MWTSTRPVPTQYHPRLIDHIFKRLENGEEPAERGSDEFPIFADDPLADAHREVAKFIVEAKGKYNFLKPRDFKLREIPSAAEMLDADAREKFRLVLAAVSRELWYWKRAVKQEGKGWRYESDSSLYPLKPLITALMRNMTGPLWYDGLLQLIDAVMIPRVGSEVRDYLSLEKLIPLVAGTCAVEGVNDEMHDMLLAMRAQMEPEQWDMGADRRLKQERSEQLDAILNPAAAQPKPMPIEPGERWADAAIAHLATARGPTKEAWTTLFEFAAAADGSQPSQKWQKQAKALVEKIGVDEFEKRLVEWFDLSLKPRTVPPTPKQLEVIAYSHHHATADIFSPRNELVLKGLAWICGVVDRNGLAIGLGNLAERCYKKIPQIGPRSPKIGNACLVALTMMNGPGAAAQLSRLKSIVKQPTGRKMIEKALGRLATRQGVTVDDLEEQTVPTFGLKEGVTARRIGDAALGIAVTPLGEIEETWQSADGKPRKAPPAALKASHAAELKAVKRELGDLEKSLTAQRLRVERLFLRQTPWPMDAWLTAYHEHPLVHIFARRLIWSFAPSGAKESVAVAWDGKRFVDSSDKPVQFDPAKTEVRLWHPSTASANEVLVWRRWLEKHEITQPFKQAHREIYLLTDAERRTETHSNRFAQHILRQHQFQALCQQRGWKYQLMGTFDFHNHPTIDIPAWNTRVEFGVEVAEGTTPAASGIAMHVSSDQVQFLDPATGAARKLADVPPLLLSEVFRDVDLFVAVTSIGNDPTWVDGGRQDHYQAYWQDYSFGELGETAKTRRAVLETLLPRLTKLKDRWSLTDRFLVIRGDLRTYKIHLGSGNIMMEPNDQYLCIVPGRSSESARDGVFLPFDGDSTLSVILSKAFLLAADTKITDSTITRQLAL